MMKLPRTLTALLVLLPAAGTLAEPQLTSWFTANSGKYARIFPTAADEPTAVPLKAATPATTWSRGAGVQSSPAYADVNEINYSANWVYIRTTGLASHIMGPWYNDAAKTNLFPNYPSNTATVANNVYRIPRVPTASASPKQNTGNGPIGRFVNGVSFFDNRDAFSYVTSSNTEVNPGDGIWNRDAYVNEKLTFDPALAHQAGNNYHYHVHPIALRYQLADHVDYNAQTNRYTESAAAPAHSPIIAWAADGYPIYGPYGYSDPTNASSGVRRMVSGFVPRDGTNGTTNITTAGRHTLPAWAVTAAHPAILDPTQYGPNVSTLFPFGRYLEDNDHLGSLGFTQTTGFTVRDFDLDIYNGRTCVTPEFPTPTYVYFCTINAAGTPAFPYNIGRQFYGTPTGGAVTPATMNADTNPDTGVAPPKQHFIGGANRAIAINTPNVSGGIVTLTWSAVEGGTYSVDAAPSVSGPWTSKPPAIVTPATTNSASSNYAVPGASGSSGTEYGRVNRTALATYDTTGQTAATVAQTTTTSYSVTANTPPTITAITNQATVRNATTSALSFTIGDSETAVTNLTVTASSSNTTLVPNANIVITGTGANRFVTVTPALGQSGTATITITVNDGTTTTSTTFTLTVPPPNVLFLIADDLGRDALAAYSSSGSLPPTPNIDALAAGGVKFTNAYGYPVCSPTRSAILTGRYGFRTGTGEVVAAASNNLLQSSEFTLPEAFAANSGLNYQLKQFGKWHLGGANTAPCLVGGWPAFAGAMLGEIADFVNWTKVTGSGSSASTSTVTTYATTENVNDALSFIGTQNAAGKPWVAWVAFNAPHTPYHKPPDHLHTYDTTVANWATLPITGNLLVHFNAAVEAMDTEIGRLQDSINLLDPAILANTDIIFIGDNGTPGATLQAPYPSGHGKDSLYEGGLRVPMIIKGPDVIAPGRTSAVLTHVVDLYSTILGLAGINVATTVPGGVTIDSQSLVPVLQNQAVTRTLLYAEQFDVASATIGGRILRDSQHKLIRKKTGTDEFYDLTADPYENTNLLAGGVGAMTAPQQTAYNSLVTQLGSYNTAPTVSTIANQSTAPSTATGAIAFTVGDAELSPSILTVTTASSNTTLVPDANVVLGGSGANRTVTITPVTGLQGTSTITVNVTDGLFTTTKTFVLTVAVAAPPTITAITTSPAAVTNADAVSVTANVQPSGGRTLTSVQLTYNTGTATTSTVTETMGTSAGAFTTAANLGSERAWTVNFAAGPPNPFTQTIAANHGAGNIYGLEMNRGTPNLTDNYITTTNAFNATGSSGYVEFYVATAALINSGGWAFQTSTDTNGTTWTTRLSETTASNHGYSTTSPYHYDLSAAERVSTLRLRFQFAGAGPANPASKISLDDIKLVTTTGSGPVTVNMTGSANGGVYTAATPIPAQATGTTVNYTITATDSAAGVTTSANQSYTVLTAAPVLSVTPATGLTSIGNQGGAFSPSSATFTLSNTGPGSMNWTAAKSAAWLTLSATSGTLTSGATTTVTASINATANSLTPGGYSDTIAFTNGTNGSGNTTRPVSLTVNATTPPAAPGLAALSPYSQGTAKTITWPTVPTATSYTLEISNIANFATILSSQTVTNPTTPSSNPTATFSNLANGVTYYYRVLATNNVGPSSYSNIVSSTQDTVAPTVTITSPASGISTAATTIAVSGTSSDALSGISKVTVNGVTAGTSNSFANWTITAPLGFGTNGITAVAYDNAGNATTTAPVNVTCTTAQTYNPLIIPEVITGTTFNLNLHQTSKQFLTGVATTTYSYNNMLMWGPTLIMNKGDWVQMNVTNSLIDTTTTHWHGFHIPAIMDGGPHQTIPGGTTWSPSFKVDNNAGTYWFHPHLHQFTQQQLTRGAGGMIIIRDPQEAALNLPRTYGIDDIPLALTSRRFLATAGNVNQFATTNSAYGDSMVVNGTLNPQVTLPAQYVRLRILNAEMERSYNLGFSDGRTFYVISTDGGLVNTPVPVTRLVLGVGERVEVLVNLNGASGTTFDLKSYNNSASLPAGITTDYPGGEPGTNGQFGSLLNNLDFTVLHITVGAATTDPIPVTTLPGTLATNTYWAAGDVTNNRAITITGGIAGATDWSFDNLAFSPTLINHTINLNAVERWTITNSSGFSHTLHIHDIQFKVESRTGTYGVQNFENGWKDTVFIKRNTTVSVIAKFDGFASNTNPFMFHCHFSPHEDEGLMGQFIVVNNAVEDLAIASFTRLGNSNVVTLNFKATPGTTYTLQYSPNMTTGSWTDVGSVTSDGTSATFFEKDTTRLGQARGFYRVAIPVVP